MVGRSSSDGNRPTRARSSAQSPPLSDLDLRILDLLSFLRVLTQTQLARSMSPKTPPRTIRYRTARLARLGLIGRTRPYRERGSAPHHLWPTRKGEAMAAGEPPPRGGERREPNPLFLAHAAAISELYVSLKTGLPDGFRLTGFKREAEAREAFRGYDGKEHAVAPDAGIQITDPDRYNLFALVELDLGTMSSRQLKAKAQGYGDYARLYGWRQTYPFCPALLFLTTSEKRARSFLVTCEKAVGRREMLVAACGLARDIDRALTAPKWLTEGGEQSADLLTILRAARRPYDEEREREEAERRADDEKREQLRSEPAALRHHLREWEYRDWDIERLGTTAATAVQLTLTGDGELAEVECRALRTLGAMFADPLSLQLAEGEPTVGRRFDLEELAEHHRARQLDCVSDLARRLGDGPALSQARGRLLAGGLLTAEDASSLSRKAADDERSRAEQERLRLGYLEFREDRARALAKSQRLVARLRNRPDAFLVEVDREALGVCGSCQEVAYPDPERARSERKPRDIAFRCHFCGGGQLAKWEPVGGGEGWTSNPYREVSS